MPKRRESCAPLHEVETVPDREVRTVAYGVVPLRLMRQTKRGKDMQMITRSPLTFGEVIAIAEGCAKGTIPRAPGSARESVTGGAGFCGTANMDEALKLAREGWRVGAEAIRDVDGLCAGVDNAPTFGHDVAGIFPDMGAFMAGEPEHMFAPMADEEPMRRIRIVIPAAYPCSVKQSAIQEYGKALAALIRSIEATGVAVSLATVHKVLAGGRVVILPVVLRDYGDTLDLDRVAFAGHPSYLRRIMFAVFEAWEDAPVEARSFTYGSCSELKVEEARIVFGMDGEERLTLLPAPTNGARAPHLLDSFRKLVEDESLKAAA